MTIFGTANTTGPSGYQINGVSALVPGAGGIPAVRVGSLSTPYDMASTPNTVRQNTFYQVINASAPTTGQIWQNLFSSVEMASGTFNDEVMPFYSGIQIDAGVTSAILRNHENRTDNYGSMGIFNQTYYYLINYPTGTIANMTGAEFGLDQRNTTANALQNFIWLHFAAMGGGGSLPQNYYAIRNDDVNAGISSLGHVLIGAIRTPSAQTLLEISGPDTSGGTFPLLIGSSGGLLFTVDDSGIATAPHTLRVSWGATNTLEFDAASAGVTPAIRAIGGEANVSLNFTTTGTGGLQINGTPGLTCSGAPTASFASTRGLVTHC